MDIVRVFTGPDGQSHFEDVAVDLDDAGAAGRISPLWAGGGVQFRDVDGLFGPGTILLAEDLTGQGHISRSVDGEPRTCLFVHLA